MITNFILYLTIIAHSRQRKQTNKWYIVYAAAFETAKTKKLLNIHSTAKRENKLINFDIRKFTGQKKKTKQTDENCI